MPEAFVPTVCLRILRTVTQKDKQYEPFWTLDWVQKYSNMWLLYISQQYLWACDAVMLERIRQESKTLPWPKVEST